MVTVNGSHGPVEPVYVPSPEYDAWNAKLPDTVGVCGNVVASATPPRRAGTGTTSPPRVAVQVAVGEPRERHRPRRRPQPPPVTVAWSCTVVPAGTDVTVACAASWITVTVSDANAVDTVSGSHGPSSRCRCRHRNRSPGTRSSPTRRRLREPGRVGDTSGVERERDDVAAAGAVQVPLVNHENVTVPVGVPSRLPVTVAWSCTVVPAGTDVTVACAASWITVTVLDATVVTVNGSHGPVEAVYVPSPEYVAWNAKLPDTPGVCANVVASATPAASSVNGADVAAAGAVQVPLVNHENVTVPVGAGRPASPVTVAWSCTVVPAGTDVTVACAASWIIRRRRRRNRGDRQRLTRPRRAGVRAVTGVRSPGTRSSRRHAGRLRERRPVRDTARRA